MHHHETTGDNRGRLGLKTSPHTLGGSFEQIVLLFAIWQPLLGLRVGKTVTAQHLGVVGTILQVSENVSDALDRLRRYQRLIFDATPISLVTGDDWVDIIWDMEDYRPGKFVEIMGNATLVQFAKSLVRGSVKPLEVRFSNGIAGSHSEYETFFGCPVFFDHENPGLRFELELLERPLKSFDPALIELLERHANLLLAELPEQSEIVDQVRKHISKALRKGEPSLESISKSMSCSSRTLRRRLGEAGTSFRKELNLVRHELAASYLQDPKMQLIDIALLVGYSEQSAFTRAFRDYCGQTPQEVRNRVLAGTVNSGGR